jgi:RNA polymerase sigma-70 factor (ECF subfamily)
VPAAPFDDAAFERLHRRSRADRWGLSAERLRQAVLAGIDRTFRDAPPTADQVARHLDALHAEDLALACACADGHEDAWDHFMREYRPALYRAGDAIAPGGAGRELADSLYAELYGLKADDAGRRSHFVYFHGRSSLVTWLRTVLAQRHVDRVRAGRRLDPLPADEAPGAMAAPAVSTDPHRPRYLAVMRESVLAAVLLLAARDRLRLNCYYAQGLTLAEIGRLTGEHEATVSRHLARTRRAIREAVETRLRDVERMTSGDIAACFASVVDDAGPLDLHDMLSTGVSRKNAEAGRSQ